MLNALVLLPFAAKAMIGNKMDEVHMSGLIENKFDKIIGDLKNTCEEADKRKLSFLGGDASGKEFSDRDRQFVNYLIWAAMNHGMREQMNALEELAILEVKKDNANHQKKETYPKPNSTDEEQQVLLKLDDLDWCSRNIIKNNGGRLKLDSMGKVLKHVATKINAASGFAIYLAYVCTSPVLNCVPRLFISEKSYWMHCACKMILDGAFSEKRLWRIAKWISVIGMYICTPIAFGEFCRAFMFGFDHTDPKTYNGAEFHITQDALSGMCLMGAFLIFGLCCTIQPQKHQGCKQTFVNIFCILPLWIYFAVTVGNLRKWLPYIGENDSDLDQEYDYYKMPSYSVHLLLAAVQLWNCFQCFCVKKNNEQK